MTQADMDCEGHQWNIPVESNLQDDCFLASVLLDDWCTPPPVCLCVLISHTISQTDPSIYSSVSPPLYHYMLLLYNCITLIHLLIHFNKYLILSLQQQPGSLAVKINQYAKKTKRKKLFLWAIPITYRMLHVNLEILKKYIEIVKQTSYGRVSDRNWTPSGLSCNQQYETAS